MPRAIPASQIVRVLPGKAGGSSRGGSPSVTPTPTPTPVPGETTGTANATGMAAAASLATKIAAGSAAAQSGVTGTGAWLRAAIGSALASTSALAISGGSFGGVGAASASGGAQATGIALKPAVGAAAGTVTAFATGAANKAGIGASTGLGVATGAGTGAKPAVGAAAAVGAATGVSGIGNELRPANKAAATALFSSAGPLDVINCDGAWYTADPAGWYLDATGKTCAAPGFNLITNAGEPFQLKIFDTADVRLEAFILNGSADAVQGNSTGDASNRTVEIKNSSKVAIRGSNLGQGMYNLYTNNCQDVTCYYSNLVRPRHDHWRTDSGPARIDLQYNLTRDTIPQPQFWYKADGTTPIISTAFQTGYIALNPDHPDNGQSVSGTLTDCQRRNNILMGTAAQCLFDADGAQLRTATTDNEMYAALPHVFMSDNATEVEFSRNNCYKMADFDPDSTDLQITMLKAGGTGNIKGGLNTYPVGTVVNASGIAPLTGAIAGSATAPIDPTWSTTGATVAGLATRRTIRPAYTPFAGTPIMKTPPTLRYDNSTPPPWNIGTWVKVAPGNILGFTWGFQTTLWTRWKLNGTIVQAAAQGMAAMKYQTVAAGVLTAEQSFDNIVWYPSDGAVIGTVGVGLAVATTTASGVAPGGSTTTLSLTDKSSRVDISGSGLIGTINAGANGHYEGRSIGKIPGAIGDWYFEFKPTQISGSSAMVGLSNSGWSNLDKDPTDFWFGKALGLLTSGFGSSDTGFVTTAPLGSSGDVANGSTWFGIYIRRSGTGGATVKMYIRMPSGWTTVGGNPNAGGGGHDISFFLVADIYAMMYGQIAGDTQTFNFGGSAYTYSVGGSPGNLS